MSDYHSINGQDSPKESLDAETFEGEVAESRKRTSGTVRSIFNILKTYIGVGVLGLPNAWKESGVIASLVSMLCIVLISLHCLNLLVEAKQQLVDKGHRVFTFGDVTKVALGRFGRVGAVLVDVILCFCQLGVCSSYIAFLGQNTQSLINKWTNTNLPWHVFAAIWICIMMLLSWIRTLKSLAPLATIATGCLAAGLVAIVAAACMSLGDAIKMHTFVKPKLVEWSNLPAMISVAIFAFEGIGFVIPAQTAIKDPKRYPFVLTFCIVVVATLYAIFGTLVYVGFGEGTQDQIIQSLLNWAQGSKGWKIVSEVITVGLIAAIAFTYPIQLFVATDIIEERIFPPKDTTWSAYWIRNNFRAFLVFATGLLALTLSQLDIIMGFIGSIGAAPLQFIFPPVIWLCINWYSSSIPKRALIIFYLCFGVAVTILGTGSNILKLVKKK